MVPDLTWYVSDAEKAKTAAALEDVGSKWVRLHVNWFEAEPSKGNYNQWWIDEYDEAITTARQAGQRVILMVAEAPAWASGSDSRNVPTKASDYADFVGYLAERFRGRVDGYEIWNEPNLKRFWSTGPNPAKYAELLKAAYPAVKAGDPNAKVVFAGLSSNDYDFLEGAYAAGVKGSFDVMATHPYTYCGSTGPSDVRHVSGRISRDSFLGYREVRATMAARGDVKPIWFTEFGWNTSSTKCDPGAGVWQGGVSESKQAQYLTEALELIEADPYVQVAIWYTFRNPYWMGDADESEARYGLLNTDFTPKPAYAALKAYAQGGTGGGDTGTGTGGDTGTGGGDTGTGTGGDTGTGTGGETGTDTGTGSGDSSTGGGTGKGKGGKKDTRTKIKVRGSRKRAARIRGRVVGASRGRVKIVIERRRHGKWRRAARTKARVKGAGRYRKRLRRLPRGKLRAYSRFVGPSGYTKSKSRRVRFRLG